MTAGSQILLLEYTLSTLGTQGTLSTYFPIFAHQAKHGCGSFRLQIKSLILLKMARQWPP